MATLKPCKSCNQEVAKSAKVCPNCGRKLRMGLFKKMLLGIVGLLVLVAILKPSAEEQAAKAQQEIEEIESAQPNGPSPRELAAIFNPMSEHTDIQRENKEKEITGQIVEWTVPVYDVKKQDDGYRIQARTTSDSVGAIIIVTPRSEEESTLIEGLKENDRVSIKGRISSVTFARAIEIEPAVLVK